MKAQLHGGVRCDAKVGLNGDKALWEQVLGVVVIDCRQDDHILTLCPVCWRRYLVHTGVGLGCVVRLLAEGKDVVCLQVGGWVGPHTACLEVTVIESTQRSTS